MGATIFTEDVDVKEAKEGTVKESYCFVSFVSNDVVEWVKELGLYETLT